MKIKEFFIKYSFFPPLSVLATNLIVSFVTRPFISNTRIHDIVSVFDKSIPFVPQFIYIYVLAFLQWAICLIYVMAADRKKSFYFCTGASVGTLLSGIVFLSFPTIMSIRPEFSGGGEITEIIGKFIFAQDTPPLNILPSIHCLSSWLCIRMIFAIKKVPFSIKVINAVFSVLVFLSVLFVKQHMIIDVPTGIIAVEAGLLITRIFKIDKKLSQVEMKLLTRDKKSEETHEYTTA